MREVLLFAVLAERAGTDRLLVADTADEAELRVRIAAACPALALLLPRCRCAVADAFVRGHLPPGPVALIPPVSGG